MSRNDAGMAHPQIELTEAHRRQALTQFILLRGDVEDGVAWENVSSHARSIGNYREREKL